MFLHYTHRGSCANRTLGLDLHLSASKRFVTTMNEIVAMFQSNTKGTDGTLSHVCTLHVLNTTNYKFCDTFSRSIFGIEGMKKEQKEEKKKKSVCVT